MERDVSENSSCGTLKLIRGSNIVSDDSPTVGIEGDCWPPYGEIITKSSLCWSSKLRVEVDYLEGKSALSFGLITPNESFSYFLLAYFDPTKGLIKADSKSNSTHFIMNHHELLTLIQSCQAILTFLVNRGLLAAKRICSCGNQMVLRDNKSDDGYHWECPVNQCRKRRSIRAGTFFEDSKIPLSHWLYIIFLWSIDESNKKVSLLTGLSLRTVITALQRLRDICSLKILHGNLKLGGRGKTIEIDESMFGHKRKYNRGRVGQGTWVFGMVERGTGRALAFRVPNRTRETLVTGLVQKFVEPGTTIISDKFSPYFNLNSIGYIHLMVNHSENFVDPYTGAHSNTIEGVWSQIKRKLKAMNGTVKSKLPCYLDEFNWRKCYPGDPFDNLLEAIAEFCPPN
ncbi:putative transposase-like protein [Stylophora pistillata]|uniref:Putative transposase-like protein n=1 Tax=Stylophora pistillata TaxID=50429 RepID=A0A2B4SXI8_STYPI|nr:putative transposase-like protein [Stylophora pistillata]